MIRSAFGIGSASASPWASELDLDATLGEPVRAEKVVETRDVTETQEVGDLNEGEFAEQGAGRTWGPTSTPPPCDRADGHRDVAYPGRAGLRGCLVSPLRVGAGPTGHHVDVTDLLLDDSDVDEAPLSETGPGSSASVVNTPGALLLRRMRRMRGLRAQG